MAKSPISDSALAQSGPLKERIIKGVVLVEDSHGSFKPLEGATIQWLGVNAATLTDKDGIFTSRQQADRLVISYTGFKPDTISVLPTNDLRIILASRSVLNEVRVTSSRLGSYISPIDPFRTTTISQKELFKAACCNLSESFETNPSVDVSFNDAVTGSKQIQLLGLAGIYTQLTVENLPGPRGLATALGLNSIAGPWIESLQLSKGTGSVANGFESIAGQINVELKKPGTTESINANVYQNTSGKTDINLNYAPKPGRKWATIFLLHDDVQGNRKMDFNRDGFRDLPTGNLFSAVNRWSFNNSKGFMTQFGIKYLHDDKTGGQVNYAPRADKFTTNSYGLGINTRRIEGFAKIGYVFPQKKYKSVGLQLSAFDHKQDSYFGLTVYDAHQRNFYSNLIYQSIIHTTAHKFRTGLSFVYDTYDELYKAAQYKRTEIVPGLFGEYTFSPSAKFDLVAGIREDHNSLYGWFTTPRLNVRFQPFKGTVLRASIGRGQRTANVFAENNSVLVSSRQVVITPSTAHGAYGLLPEVAWNKGISIDQKLKLFSRTASFGLDFYRNDFVNQVVVDIEDPRLVRFYNLRGKSYSNSVQAELAFKPLERTDVKLAYRIFNVETTYGSSLLEKPLTARNRAFANAGYETDGWKFDYTITYTGRKRIPPTTSNPPAYQRGQSSPAFFMMSAQISKLIAKKNSLEVYIGGENLTNYFQRDAIIAADQPFSQFFDASLVWSPVTGRMFY
ncbi:MAG TPA: TonB-dependent receptor, partial [Chitinophagaceae bacterium]